MPVDDENSLKAWLTGQRREVVVVIAARTALRVLPMVIREAQERPSIKTTPDFAALTSSVFRATALAWVSSRHPGFFNDLGAAANLAANDAHAVANFDLVSAARVVADVAAVAAAAVADFARAAVAEASNDQSFVESITVATVGNVSASVSVAAASFDYASVWEEVRSDIAALQELRPSDVARLPLWSRDVPHWAKNAWAELRVALPEGEDWVVWVDWYEQRLNGVWRDETHEVTFAAVPKAVWEKGPAAANAWILQILTYGGELAIFDRNSLEVWLSGQSREVAVSIAARAALRVAPLAVRLLRDRQTAEGLTEVATLTSAIFRSSASARVAARYPVRVDEIRAESIAASHSAALAVSAPAVSVASANAATLAASAIFAADFVSPVTAAVLAAIAAAGDANALNSEAANHTMWEEIRLDCASVRKLGVNTASDRPLWSNGAPEWAGRAWLSLQEALPEGENWEVWIDWYEERLRGVSRGEAYELVFASVPDHVWDKGPVAANAWIRENLPPIGTDLREPEIEIKDRKSLEDWLKGQRAEVAVAIATRAALRVAPLAAEARERPGATGNPVLSVMTSAVFRASAVAWVATKYPAHSKAVRAAADAADAAGRFATTDAAALVADVAAVAVDAAFAADAEAARFAAARAAAFAADSAAATTDAAEAVWEAVRADVAAAAGIGANGLTDLPLWRDGGPAWAIAAWMRNGCAAVRAARLTISSSLAFPERNGTGALPPRMPGYESSCRSNMDPSPWRACRRRFPTSTHLSLTAGTLRSALKSPPARKTCPTILFSPVKRNIAARWRSAVLAQSDS